jgi:hypothetical protein
MPGVSANTTDELHIGNPGPAGFAATLPYSINGNRNSADNWTVDGIDNVDCGSDSKRVHMSVNAARNECVRHDLIHLQVSARRAIGRRLHP